MFNGLSGGMWLLILMPIIMIALLLVGLGALIGSFFLTNGEEK